VTFTDRVGPTAHYTSYVWVRNGLSHPGLATTEGRVMFESLQPAMLASRAVGGPTLEAYLLARHEAIDALLERAIEDAGVSQVIEVACGLSPRGWRFADRYGERLRYVEAIWRRFARALEAFPTGRYISDLHLGSVATLHVRAFRLVLGAFVRGRVYLHFSEAREAEAALVAAGFGAAHVGPAVEIDRHDRDPGSRLANILEASITLPPEVSPT
jgi:hypothetical protein